MLTLVTGTPGAGKTLYAVSALLPEYLKQTVEIDDDGVVKPVKRRILVDGIKNLIIEHELMAKTVNVSKVVGRDVVESVECEGEGVANWWEWCKPGDVIVIDEVQRLWRPRGNGSKVPQMIAELETHRHRGVDFILITQHPMLLDQNIRRLVSRHIHIRRMWGGSRAVRYEWDHCSGPERVGDASKTYWPYPKDAFKYYKSAEVHTKQGGRVPAALLVLGLAALALPAVGYFAVSRTQNLFTPVAAAAQPITTTTTVKTLGPPVAVAATAGSSVALPAVADTIELKQEVAGCIASATRCKCFDSSGLVIKMELQTCRDSVVDVGLLVPLRMSYNTQSSK